MSVNIASWSAMLQVESTVGLHLALATVHRDSTGMLDLQSCGVRGRGCPSVVRTWTSLLKWEWGDEYPLWHLLSHDTSRLRGLRRPGMFGMRFRISATDGLSRRSRTIAATTRSQNMCTVRMRRTFRAADVLAGASVTSLADALGKTGTAAHSRIPC
jgi:hypothetical protein